MTCLLQCGKGDKIMHYKLTNKDLQTHNGFQWELDKWYEIPVEKQGNDLCTESWFHCYNHPLLAVLLNPIHADIKNPRLFEVEVEGNSKENCGLKFGFTKMRLIKEMEVPKVTTEQRIKFGILCALEVYKEDNFVRWGQDWLSSKDKTKGAAASAADAADAASAASAAYVAAVAASAANAAAYAASVANAAAVAASAVYAAYAATDAAYVAYVAYAAADAVKIDLTHIVKLACSELK